MKKGQKIYVRENASYKGQDMNWSETFTGKKKISKNGEWVTHSSQNEIKAFAEKKICVHPHEHSKSYFKSDIQKKDIKNKFSWKIFIYSIYLPENTIVDTYSDDEYRFDLDSSFNIVFSGIVYQIRGEQKKSNQTGRMVDTYLQFSDTIVPR